jgi:hypothetical protein
MNHRLPLPRIACCLAVVALAGVALAGCQNGSQQLSLYAPFGPAVVPPPALSRANSAPYYSAPNVSPGHGSGTTPATASAASNSLSYLDPYRGVMVPGGFTAPPISPRSGDLLGTEETSRVAIVPRPKPSSEAPIRVMDADSSPRGLSSAINSAVTQATSSRSGVKFQASPPSGVVPPGAALLPPPPDTQVELAQLPKPPVFSATNAAAGANNAANTRIIAVPTVTAGSTPASPPATLFGTPPATLPTIIATPSAASPTGSNPAGGLAPFQAVPRANPTNARPAAQPNVIPAKPATGNRLSLWDDPGDGSRVMPASLESPADTIADDQWQKRSPLPN